MKNGQKELKETPAAFRSPGFAIYADFNLI